MFTVLESLNTALHFALASDERVIILGEDILDPYGGAFKVTRGLSTAFPDRVLTTPISEAGIVGVAAGMAMRGLRPVVEIMFDDFITLIADQVVNHIAKFRWMYNDQVRVPLVIRTPMGGWRGYGPTHSQTLEKLFLGVPGLRVLAPCALQVCKSASGQEAGGKRQEAGGKRQEAGGKRQEAGGKRQEAGGKRQEAGGKRQEAADGAGALLAQAILRDDDPVLFIENKLLYLLPVQDESTLTEFTLTRSPRLLASPAPQLPNTPAPPPPRSPALPPPRSPALPPPASPASPAYTLSL
ncbi:MAG: hypothetical protein ABIG63_08335, partial [Chloroflexota bacterium]